MLPDVFGKTDFFVHQCYFEKTPTLKMATFMSFNPVSFDRVFIVDNDHFNSSMTLNFKNGVWEDGETLTIKNNDALREGMYKLNYRLVTAAQFKQMMKTQPTEVCAQ